MTIHPGILYVVASPIGNLGDISLRALDILRQVDIIAAEDTRHSQRLLQHYEIQTKLVAYHEHNERESAARFISQCLQGKSIALLSDAGTPLISDPGYHLVKAAHEAKIKIIPIPGPCAAITALSIAGLPSDKFVFEGFLPPKTNPRKLRLQKLQSETRTIIFYEAPHRIEEMLKDIKLIFGAKREATLARELTKAFETIYKSNITELINFLKSDANQTKGEFVIIIAGISQDELEQLQEQKANALLDELLVNLPLKKAVKITAEIMQVSKNDLYSRAIERKDINNDQKL